MNSNYSQIGMTGRCTLGMVEHAATTRRASSTKGLSQSPSLSDFSSASSGEISSQRDNGNDNFNIYPDGQLNENDRSGMMMRSTVRELQQSKRRYQKL